MSILKDEDTNPNTITFTTDKFSAYAIASLDNGGANTSILVYVLLVLIVLLAVASIFTLVKVISRKSRR